MLADTTPAARTSTESWPSSPPTNGWLTPGGPAYPVLLWLHSATRETHLHDALAGTGPGCPVATAVRHAACPGPAGPVWHLAGTGARRWLHELPSDHGGDSPVNPNWRHGHLVLHEDECDGRR